MNYIEYFKLQAKKLFKDFKTQEPYIDDVSGFPDFKYHPKYFDIEYIIISYNINEKKFSLMNAQHIIALMSGFNKWNTLIKASEKELELAFLLFEYQNKINVEEWKIYVNDLNRLNNCTFDIEEQIKILKTIFIENKNAHSDFSSFLLKHQL